MRVPHHANCPTDQATIDLLAERIDQLETLNEELTERVAELTDIMGVLAKACDEHIAEKRRLREALQLCASRAGSPSATDACRYVIATAREALSGQVVGEQNSSGSVIEDAVGPGCSKEKTPGLPGITTPSTGIAEGSQVTTPAPSASSTPVCHFCNGRIKDGETVVIRECATYHPFCGLQSKPAGDK